MALTQTDLDNIDAALASGELSVRFTDGRQVEYRSVSDLLDAKRAITAELAPAAAPRYQQADFSDG